MEQETEQEMETEQDKKQEMKQETKQETRQETMQKRKLGDEAGDNAGDEEGDKAGDGAIFVGTNFASKNKFSPVSLSFQYFSLHVRFVSLQKTMFRLFFSVSIFFASCPFRFALKNNVSLVFFFRFDIFRFIFVSFRFEKQCFACFFPSHATLPLQKNPSN